MTRDDSILQLFKTMSYEESRDTFPLTRGWLFGKNPFKCFVQGKFEHSNIRKEDRSEPIKDLCTNESIATFFPPVKDDMQNVLQSSSQGQKVWNGMNPHCRGELLSQITKTFEEKKDFLSEIEALTLGSNLFDAKGEEIPRACSYFYNNALMSHSVEELEGNNGVVLVILPVPVPLFALSAITSSALAAGCAVIINPQVQPLTAFALAELCSEAGLPPGVLNAVAGSLSSSAKDLLKELGIVRQIVVWGTKMTIKQTSLELASLGLPILPFYYGKTISIVFDSCNIQTTIDVLLKNMRFTKYQHPWSVRTLFVEESVFECFVSALKQRLSKMSIGSARVTGVEMGLPETMSEEERVTLTSTLKEFAARGVEVYQRSSGSISFPPTLIIGTDGEANSLEKTHDPIPFVSLVPFRGTKDVISFANKNHFGVAASVWTSCSALALHVASNLQVGTVWINEHGTVDASIPFVSTKHGFGCIGGFRGLQQMMLGSGCPQQSTPTSDEVQVDVKQPIKKEDSSSFGALQKPLSRNDVCKAVDAANAAFLVWKKLSGPARASLLLSAAKKLQDCSQNFVRYFSQPEEDHSQIVSKAIKALYTWASRSQHLLCERSSSPVSCHLVHSELSPLGVIGIVVDTSSDFYSLTSAVSAAVSYGNSVVALVNDSNPVAVLELCDFLSKQRLPAGLINALPTSSFTLCSELLAERNIHAVWYVGNNVNSWSLLQATASKASKLLWRFRGQTPSSVAALSKAIWMPCENGSC